MGDDKPGRRMRSIIGRLVLNEFEYIRMQIACSEFLYEKGTKNIT